MSPERTGDPTPRTCALIVLLYSPDRLARSLRLAGQLQLLCGVLRTVFVINGTALHRDMVAARVPRSGAVHFITHDNTGAEFGGYQAGLDCLLPQLPDRVVVMNDTVGTHDLTTPALLHSFARQLELDLGRFIIGTIFPSQRRLELDGLWTSRWMRTHLFGLSRDALQGIDGRLYHPHIDHFVTAAPHPAEFFGAHVRGELRLRIEEFLFRPGPTSWYAARPLDAANCSLMAAKARSILQEKYLAMKLEAADTAFRSLYLTRAEWLRHRTAQVTQSLRDRLGLPRT